MTIAVEARGGNLNRLQVALVQGSNKTPLFDSAVGGPAGAATDEAAGIVKTDENHIQLSLVERAGRVLDRYERATLLLQAIERFTAAGHIHLGLDHFARPGSRLARAAPQG